MNDKNKHRLDTNYPLYVMDKENPEVEGLVVNRNIFSTKRVDTSNGATFDHPSRWEVIERTLRQGKEFLQEQDRQLKLAGALLDNFRKALTAFDEDKIDSAFKLHSQIFSCGIRDISSEAYRGVSLFGNNTHAPLKFHTCESGERKVIEVTKGNLSGPALQAIVRGEGSPPPSENLLLEATKEILELRAINCRQSENLRRSYTKVLEKLKALKEERNSLLGKTDSFSFLERQNKHVGVNEGGMCDRVHVARRLVDFFITSSIHKFSLFTHRR
jgi:hypothetical protein